MNRPDYEKGKVIECRSTNMLTAECPECEGKITFSKQPELGHRFHCQHCDADIEVVWLDPLYLRDRKHDISIWATRH